MTPPARVLASALVGCVLVVSGWVEGSASAEAAAPPPSAAVASRAATRVELVLTRRATKQLLFGNNQVEGRGGARTTLVSGQLHAFLRYRRPGQLRGVKALVGRLVFTGDGPDVRWRQLRVDFTGRRISGLGAKGKRFQLLQLISLHGGGTGGGADTALILTDRGSDMLNRAAAKPQAFAPGDLVARANGLS